MDGYWDHQVNLWLTAAGNDKYRPAAASIGGPRWSGPPIDTQIDAALDGIHQTITFKPLESIKPGATVELSATSDSGLPVSFYIVAGPVSITGSTLTALSLPAGGASSVPATIAAVQRGNDKYRVAAVVWQTFDVTHSGHAVMA